MNQPPPLRAIFEEPAEDLGRAGPEEGPLGFLIGGMANALLATLGSQYLKAAEVLFDQVESCAVWDYEIGYPALRLLRHAIGLVLKACLAPPPHGQDLRTLSAVLAERLQREHGAVLPAEAEAKIAEFSRFDPGSIAFRYSRILAAPSRGFDPIPLETHVELLHLRRTIRPVTQGLAELAPALAAEGRPGVLWALAMMDGAGACG